MNSMLANKPLFGYSSRFMGDVDRKGTLRNASELAKRIERPLNVAKGVFDVKVQSLDVFYARQLIAEVKRTIRSIGDKDKELGEILDFVLFKKNSYNTVTDASFYVEHCISERNYYKKREKALLMFANEFNAGELLVFKD